MIVVDIESTGIEAFKHSIVSIGAVEFENPKNRFYEECRIWQGAHVMKESLEFLSLTEMDVKDPNKPPVAEVLKRFIKWALARSEHTFAGQNPSFDRDFLKVEAERNHLDWPFAHRTIDLHSVCYAHMIKRNIAPPIENHRSALNSDKISIYVGIKPEARPHKAINGALQASECLSRLLYGKTLLQEFAKFPLINID